MYSKSSAQGCPKAREAADGVVAVFAVSTLVAVFAAFDIITWALVAKLAVFALWRTNQSIKISNMVLFSS